jgi:CheY-like chemotaxis protein
LRRAGASIHDPRVPRRILLVHDDLTEIANVRRALAGEDHEVVLATNASEALAEIARARPDVVLLAPACDGGEGAAVARELAASGAGVPLIAIGGGAKAPGTFRVLLSPIDGAALRAAVQAAVREATARLTATATATAPSPRPPARAKRSDGVAAESKGPPPRGGEGEEVDISLPFQGVASSSLPSQGKPGSHLPPPDAGRRRELEEEERWRAAALARVAEKLEQVRRADYFAILEIDRCATTDDVREATRRLLSEMASDRFGAEAPDGLVPELEEIREVVTDACEVLADPDLRAQYGAAIDPQNRGNA